LELNSPRQERFLTALNTISNTAVVVRNIAETKFPRLKTRQLKSGFDRMQKTLTISKTITNGL
jgi:hypothetical protein